MKTHYFEDFSIGDVFESDWRALSEEEILNFAESYDPQPMHVDRAWAAQGPHGELIASGFQTTALAFRLFWDTGVMKGSNIIGIGLNEIRWYKPVKAGQRFRARGKIMGLRESRSKPDRGVVNLELSLIDEAGEMLLSYEDVSFVRKRPPAG